MFRALVMLIFRSIILYSLWYEALYMLSAVGFDADGQVHPHPIQKQATYKVLRTTDCILQSNAPEDEHN
jgi:hypothetical protein